MFRKALHINTAFRPIPRRRVYLVFCLEDDFRQSSFPFIERKCCEHNWDFVGYFLWCYFDQLNKTGQRKMPKVSYPPQGGEKHLCLTLFCTMMLRYGHYTSIIHCLATKMSNCISKMSLLWSRNFWNILADIIGYEHWIFQINHHFILQYNLRFWSRI